MFDSRHLILELELEPKELVEKLKSLVVTAEIYRLWQKDEIRQTNLVFIGRFLQLEKIQSEVVQ